MKRFFEKIVFVSICLFAFLACSSGNQVKDNKKVQDTLKITDAKPLKITKPNFLTGKIIDSVACRSDSTLFYSLYLPSDYTTSKKWPIMYFFDPHGAGKLPLSKYYALGEKYHFILVGFYNSHNGLDFNTINNYVKTLINDTRQVLSINPDRVYTAGFSGGAKVAGLIAGYDGGIKGVIACGAGLPQLNQPPQYPFDYFGIAGKSGFNYLGLKMQDAQMEKMHYRHQFISFDGKHEWPPKEIMRSAFNWIQLNAMRSKLIPHNDSLINVVKSTLDKKITQYKNKKDAYKLYLTYKKATNYLKNLVPTKTYLEKADSLAQTIKIKNKETENDSLASIEMQLRQEYVQDLAGKNESWWKNKVTQLHKSIRLSKNESKSYMYKRVLAFLSLAGYMQASNTLKQNDIEAAAHYINIFTIIDPTNPDHSYLSACLNAQKGNKDKSLKDLKQAIKLGFTDVNRIKSNKYFTPFRNDLTYKKIIQSLQ